PALLLAMCLGIAVAAILSSLQPPIYGSRIALEVEGLNENYLDLRNVYPTIAPGSDAAGLLQTQAEIFTQDALLQRVARKLTLETGPESLSNSTIAERLREDIRIEPPRNSRILQIVCDARDAALAASLCNSLAEDGIENAIATRQRIARQTFDSLEPRLDD